MSADNAETATNEVNPAQGSETGVANGLGSGTASDPQPSTSSQTPPITLTTTITSLPDTVADNSVPLATYKMALFRLVECPQPERSEREADQEPTSKVYRILRMWRFAPWRNDEVLGYEELVARYIALWSVLERKDAQQFTFQALLGLSMLTAGRFVTSSQILNEIEFQTSAAVALSYVMKGVASFIKVLFFVVVLIVYPYMVFNGFSPKGFWALGDLFQIAPGHVLIATVAGMLGSVVSILLRLGEFEATRGRSRMFLSLTGATLPFVGGMFGAFVAALFSANIINITSPGAEGLNAWLFLVVGFLSGFSERFSRGFIKMTEDRFVGGAEPERKPSIAAQAVASGGQLDAVGLTVQPGKS